MKKKVLRGDKAFLKGAASHSSNIQNVRMTNAAHMNRAERRALKSGRMKVYHER